MSKHNRRRRLKTRRGAPLPSSAHVAEPSSAADAAAREEGAQEQLPVSLPRIVASAFRASRPVAAAIDPRLVASLARVEELATTVTPLVLDVLRDIEGVADAFAPRLTKLLRDRGVSASRVRMEPNVA